MGLKDFFYGAAANVGSLWGNEASKDYLRIRDAENPSQEVMNVLRKIPGMDTQENLEAITIISGDKSFMTALDSAIKSDSGIIRTLGEIGEGADDKPQDPSALLNQLKDGMKRGLMTEVLAKIGENPDDELDGTHLKTVVSQAQDNDLIGLNTTVQGMGINHTMLHMGATAQSFGLDVTGGSPLQQISGFLANPDKAIAGWIDNPNGPFQGLDDQSKSVVAQLVKLLAGFANIYMPGQGIIDPYLDFGRKYFGEMVAHGDALRDTSAGKPAEPNAIQVAESIRPSSAFNKGAAANDPTFDAENPAQEATRVAGYENRGSGQALKMVMN